MRRKHNDLFVHDWDWLFVVATRSVHVLDTGDATIAADRGAAPPKNARQPAANIDWKPNG